MKTTEDRLAVLEDRVDVHDRRIAVAEGFIKLFAQLLAVGVNGMVAQLKKYFGEEL